jgi:hypothetical protein
MKKFAHTSPTKSWILVISLLLMLSFNSCHYLQDRFGSKKQSSESAFIVPQISESDYRVKNNVQHRELLSLGDKEFEQLYNRGAYLANSVSACGYCHSSPNSSLEEINLSGGKSVSTRKGLVTASNITPELETGIGRWSVSNVVDAIRLSKNRDGVSFSKDVHDGFNWMSDVDSRSIAIYILSQQPVKRIDISSSKAISAGVFGFLEPDANAGFIPGISQAVTVDWGRYLAHNVARCESCHTPEPGMFSKKESFSGRSTSSSFISRLNPFVSADKNSSESDIVGNRAGPDIRGSSEQGISRWKEEDIVSYLSTGEDPAGLKIRPENCPWSYYKNMNQTDKSAIAKYLKSI